jgi:hypothetical protein
MIAPNHRGIACRFAWLLFLIPICVSMACESGGSKASPTITAQGFDMLRTREVLLGETSQLRLRIEAPSGIEQLLVRERSYEVDLAQSPETTHFPLFGLPRRVWSKTDVTLDFGPYVAEKIKAPGEYAFSIVVSDRSQQTTEETLRILVRPKMLDTDSNLEPSPPQTQPAIPGEPGAATETSMRTAPFRLERVGPGRVLGGEEFGVTWKTIDSGLVVIRLRGNEMEESRFARLEPGAFASIDTHEKFVQILNSAETRMSLDLTTAVDRAAGAVFAIVHSDESYLLRTDHSATTLSDLGTTVTLTGRYKK